MEKTAIILSGGTSSRMSYTNKAFLEMGEHRLIEIIIKKVSNFDEIIIVSNTPSDYAYLGVKVVTDIIPKCGPLSGIHSGLTHAKFHHSIVLACDMPFITSEVLEFMAGLSEGYDVVVPKVKGEYEPLCGIYGKNCIIPIETCLKNQKRKIIDIYGMVRVKDVKEDQLRDYGDPEYIFRNINNHEEYLKYCQERVE